MSKPSLYPRLALSVSTTGRRCIHALYKVFFLNANPGIRRLYSHALPSLYPRIAVTIATPFHHYSHALYKVFKKMQIQDVAIATPFRRYRHAFPSL